MKPQCEWQDKCWADVRSLLSRVKALEEHHALEERRKQEECLGKHQDRDEGGQTAEASYSDSSLDAACGEIRKQAEKVQAEITAYVRTMPTLESPDGIYIAGPMTGFADHNFGEFNRVALKLRQAGHRVVNPAELNPDKPGYPIAMRRDIAAMLTCNTIMILPSWERSDGAFSEFHIARILQMTFKYWEVECSRY